MPLFVFYRIAIAMELGELHKDIPHAHRSTGTDQHASERAGRGEATSSQNQVMTYPYYVRILKPSPPTIYHGQGLA